MKLVPYLLIIEAQAIAINLTLMVKEGRLPPDDAYAWTRIVCAGLRDVGLLRGAPVLIQ